MKYGIITDIHSNILALKTVLNKFEELKVDKIICCGDIIGIGPCPEEAVQELINLNDRFIGVRGNHEKYLLTGLPKEVHDDKRGLSKNEINCHLWNQSRLSSTSKSFLAALPYENIIEENGKRICILHYPMNEEKKYKRHIKFPTIDECRELFENYSADIYLYGHTHTKSIVKEENKLYINVRSLGCPMDENVTNFGILTINNDIVNYEDFKLEYNVEMVIKEIEKFKYPMYEKIIDIFFGSRHSSNNSI